MNEKETNYYNAVSAIISKGHWITDQITRILKPYNITEPQYNVLRILEDKYPSVATVQEIQEEMLRKSSNVTRIIDKLLDKGFVSREIRPDNRRKMDIKLTEDGFKTIEKLNEVVHNFHDPINERVTEEECINLIHILKKLDVTL